MSRKLLILVSFWMGIRQRTEQEKYIWELFVSSPPINLQDCHSLSELF